MPRGHVEVSPLARFIRVDALVIFVAVDDFFYRVALDMKPLTDLTRTQPLGLVKMQDLLLFWGVIRFPSEEQGMIKGRLQHRPEAQPL